jgi:hypothetical protein
MCSLLSRCQLTNSAKYSMINSWQGVLRFASNLKVKAVPQVAFFLLILLDVATNRNEKNMIYFDLLKFLIFFSVYNNA